MASRDEILGYCDDLLQAKAIKDYCPNGLQIEGRGEVQRVAVAVSASMDVIQRACHAGIDMLVVHHGIFWNRDPYSLMGTKYQKVKALIESELSLLAYHLPLDVHQELGNNWAAAQEMGWADLKPFAEVEGVPLGVKGTVTTTSVEKFQQQLEGYYNHSAHVALGGVHDVSSVALISGGAHKMVYDAAAEGVDCFITGSFDEPVWHAAKEEGIHFFALGHHATETVGVRRLGKVLHERFGVAVEFLNEDNPF